MDEMDEDQKGRKLAIKSLVAHLGYDDDGDENGQDTDGDGDGAGSGGGIPTAATSDGASGDGLDGHDFMSSDLALLAKQKSKKKGGGMPSLGGGGSGGGSIGSLDLSSLSSLM